MTVQQLTDKLTAISHEGNAQLPVNVVVDGKCYENIEVDYMMDSHCKIIGVVIHTVNE